ncbi:MAG: TlyA family RNA methyltransferase [Sphaerobacter thermophilus]|uniref:TlyA family RNA methyltransferase n=1 Tax=Sphaerobacter thermophilus TaxID=2057 RepID=UPI00396DDFE4
MSKRVRADELLVARGLAETRSRARAMIMAGSVRSGDRVIDKPGTLLPPDAPLDLRERPRFVSRGGEKLDWALEQFALDVRDRICADFGASTGGFTDVLLQRGAARVYAIDVGYGQLDYRLRQDPRVVVLDRTNVRYLESLPEPIDIVTIDVSFISLALVLPAALRVLKPDGSCVALIKPQFEAGREKVGKGGVVRDPRVHREVLRRVLTEAQSLGFTVRGLTPSPIRGPAGNVEFLVWLSLEGGEEVDPEPLIDVAMAALSGEKG